MMKGSRGGVGESERERSERLGREEGAREEFVGHVTGQSFADGGS